ncbi:iron chelate uptake ABC transporter family permease subunit [Microlunatus parietis]|uniref:Iron complex transport system permease protein n=1 Tax=Microlunatus parietis TaxID=682979 RepID=A0A7Y9LA82_9ACTN|nr:iron chelate uptake ABC transporter family permease subunit [Microlunatus parietis]NYE70382.1 iron complex transport system permease protein [Microlunatus parietis]
MTAVITRSPAAPSESPRPTGRRAGTPVWLVGLVLVILLAASVLAATAVGASGLGPAHVLQSIGHHLGLTPVGLPRLDDAIIFDLRLPRVLTAALVGAALALSGAVMQTLTQNPLADPYLLGLSSGAALGAVSVLLLGVGLVLPLAAFLGAMLALAGALALAGRAATRGSTRIVLAGIAVAQICSAGTSFVIFSNAQGDSYREVLAWLMGSLGGADWSSLAVAGPIIVAAGLVLLGYARSLDAFAFGDQLAGSLGVATGPTRMILLGLVALLTGSAVAVSGAIGFLGLTLPHAVRFVTGPAHARLLPVLAPAGAIFLVWTDTAARTVLAPEEVPVGILTALIGAPVFCVLLWRQRRAA